MEMPCIVKCKILKTDPTFLKLQAKRILSVPWAPDCVISTTESPALTKTKILQLLIIVLGKGTTVSARPQAIFLL